MPSPMPIHEEEEDSIVGTGIIDGCFCMARKDEKTQVIQVLLMKEYGKQESWVTAFVIPLLRFQPYADYNLEFLSQNGKVFILVKGSYYTETYVYDVTEDKLEHTLLFRGEVNVGCVLGICFYIESFYLPNDVSWRDNP
ncbi:unnamed protein product [Cuscuta epithymum]|uniref:F-box associated domain-containing protein n=1 Tax=Cuscuta epithymum TaxID=186058 RepID=A0AAV0FN73_9ASTE|nr:unnamed protein product [Cuscuta epithymum]